MGYTDPTELMVNNLELGIPDYVVGAALLALYVCIELIAIPINIIRDAKPVHHTVVRSPEKNFKDAYKMGYHFRGEYLNLEGLPRIHYLDEGNIYSNETIVLLHGEPFWSHSWSKLIPYLTKAGYRVIAPDFIGFGKSDKFVDYRAYTVSLHKRALAGLLAHLNIPGSVTLVGHNWGWMIGSAFAKDNPGYFSRFVILNTNNVPDGEIELNRYSLL
ncbi:uncharacterized protein LOC111706133 isoform X2 [Eurytemora carolleeae]|uniref:uncharacterized protein LOC111706133 isoform X2 n=1 Tax=Eurytemora carolleeae TaxID=1294199 RepID=UPI000C786DDC|nr:uncharacterized protein LOC111706133 isoform X2 [Eurytemora carolleeae]|eukprot:XP_023334685.1 uncharacterized protein LOC111706133 isoform X2 [Eurytemora affinis]